MLHCDDEKRLLVRDALACEQLDHIASYIPGQYRASDQTHRRSARESLHRFRPP